jgi:L-lactate dehydrogenase complex protein LldG
MIAHSNSRQRILDRLRSIPIQANEVAPIDTSRLVHYEDPVAKFTEILTLVGGTVHGIEHLGQVNELLQTLPAFTTARHVASLVPDAVEGNFYCHQVDDPHALAALDWAIVRGEFAVAENGAVWVHPANLTERTMLFITQHLAVIVSRSAIAMHMHDAYQRLRAAGHCGLSGPDFGVFICGPSKTADIEQSLVIGAHGCRTMHVFLTP